MSTARFNDWEQAVQWLREQPQQQELVRAAYYDDPLEVAAERYWLSEEWQAVKPLLGVARLHALDVGAGRGIASYALAKEGFSKVTALEPDPSGLVGAGAIRSLALHSHLPIEITQEFSERLPYADSSFDVVFARAVLHHTRDLTAACSEFYRVLRPGGRLVAVREHVITRQEDLPDFLEIHPLHRLYGGENAFLLNEYQAAIQLAGLRLVNSIAPFDSPINFAPDTLLSLQEKIAARLAKYIPVSGSALARILSLLWPMLRPLLNRFDNRPGRLYSFLAMKH